MCSVCVTVSSTEEGGVIKELSKQASVALFVCRRQSVVSSRERVREG